MSKKPDNFEWLGFTPQQRELLDLIDQVGNNGWDRNGQTETLMPNVLAECADLGLTITQIMAAMVSIGYDRRTVQQLERWERKRTTGAMDPRRPKRVQPKPTPPAPDPGRRSTRNWW